MTCSDEVFGYLSAILHAFGLKNLLYVLLQEALPHGLVHQSIQIPDLVIDNISFLLADHFL